MSELSVPPKVPGRFPDATASLCAEDAVTHPHAEKNIHVKIRRFHAEETQITTKRIVT